MDSYSGWDDSKDSTVITLGTGLSLEFSRLKPFYILKFLAGFIWVG